MVNNNCAYDVDAEAAMMAEEIAREAMEDLEIEKVRVDCIDDQEARLLADEIAKLAISDCEVEGIRYGAMDYGFEASADEDCIQLKTAGAGVVDHNGDGVIDEKDALIAQLLEIQRSLLQSQMLSCDRAILKHTGTTGVHPTTGERVFTPGPKPGEPDLTSLIEAAFADFAQQHTDDCAIEVEKIKLAHKQNAAGEDVQNIAATLSAAEAKAKAEAKSAAKAAKSAAKAKAQAEADAANAETYAAANVLSAEAQAAADAEAEAAAKVGALKAEVEAKARRDEDEKARKEAEEQAELDKWNKVFEDKADNETENEQLAVDQSKEVLLFRGGHSYDAGHCIVDVFTTLGDKIRISAYIPSQEVLGEVVMPMLELFPGGEPELQRSADRSMDQGRRGPMQAVDKQAALKMLRVKVAAGGHGLQIWVPSKEEIKAQNK